MNNPIREPLNERLLRSLLILSVLVNVSGLLSSVLGSNDANFYSVIAKHIVLSNDWLNLTFAGQPWLDKPHLPFWLTAVSYKIFGINTFAYILPGCIFNLLGARYTYLLARHIYNHQVGLLAAIFYLTTLHLMLSAIDVRAEAYLMGEIMPACYYWLLYHQTSVVGVMGNANATMLRRIMSANYLLRGAFFTALAIMTKGIFVLITIFSALVVLIVYTKSWTKYISRKWVNALFLSLLFITPELVALIVQFDLHPELVVFGHTHVSGIKFFFWDSQFGRFFDTGPITSGKPGVAPLHYFFFIHTFLWAFLPWSMLFFIAVWQQYKKRNWQYFYLLGAILPTFLLFSLSKFQLDYYINIIFPFAAIMCASYVSEYALSPSTQKVFTLQMIIAWLLPGIVVILNLMICSGFLCVVILGLSAFCYWLFFLSYRIKKRYQIDVAIANSVLAISLVFIFVMLVNNYVYSKYDLGYTLGRYLNAHEKHLVVDYQLNSASLEFHSHDAYQRVNSPQELPSIASPYYLVIKKSQWHDLLPYLPKNTVVVQQVPWIPQEQFISTLLSRSKHQLITQGIILLLVK